jgi:hypothetical protein
MTIPRGEQKTSTCLCCDNGTAITISCTIPQPEDVCLDCMHFVLDHEQALLSWNRDFEIPW